MGLQIIHICKLVRFLEMEDAIFERAIPTKDALTHSQNNAFSGWNFAFEDRTNDDRGEIKP